MKRTLIPILALAFTAGAAVPLAAGRSHSAASTTIAVSGKEYSFKLSKKSARHGVVVFKFKNVGAIAHDFKIAGKKTPLVQPGDSATLRVKLKHRRYKYLCTVPGHAAAGMKGVFKAR